MDNTNNSPPEEKGAAPERTTPNKNKFSIYNTTLPGSVNFGGLTKPLVSLPGNGVQNIDTAREVFKIVAPHHEIFYRGGAVFELNSDNNGNVCLNTLRPAAAITRFEKYCDFVAPRKGPKGEDMLAHRPMRKETAESLLHSREAQELLPNITGLINCPIIKENEDKLTVIGKGYDSETGLLITGGEKPPKIELKDAVESLKSILAEFDFQSSGDKSRTFASLLTPALKMGGFIKGNIPIDVAEANESQSGKTYRIKLVAALYNEELSFVARRDGGVGSLDESISERLVKGHPFILLDNLRGRLDSQFLEAFLTAGSSFHARIPHKGSIEIDPSRFFISLASNGVITTQDMANRSSIVRINKQPQDFRFKEYPEGDLHDHLKANQPYYLGCVFAVIQAYIEAGQPRTGETTHDFREWAQRLDWIVQEILLEAPLIEGHRAAQERVSNPAQTFFREVCIATDRQSRLGEELSATNIFDICQEEGITIPGLSEEKQDDEKAAPRQIGKLASKVFNNTVQVELDSWTLTRSKKHVRRDCNGTTPLTVYTITRKEELTASEDDPF
jgi:hypothetical protein